MFRFVPGILRDPLGDDCLCISADTGPHTDDVKLWATKGGIRRINVYVEFKRLNNRYGAVSNAFMQVLWGSNSGA